MSKISQKYKSLPKPVKASFWFLICSFLQKGISMITTPIFTRLLTTGEYGRYNVFNSWYSIVSIIVSLNLWAGVYQQGLIKFNKQRKVFSSSLEGLTFTLICIWTAVYLVSHNFWNGLFNLTTVQMLAMLCMVWTSSVFSFWSTEQRVDYKYKKLVLITLSVSVLKPFVGIIFVIHAEDKVTARILGLALVELIGYSWCFIYQMKRGKKFYSKQFWKYALGYNIPLVPHYLSQVVLNNSDRIMISSMVGDSASGIYSLAYSLAMIMALFNTALTQTLTPWMYQKIKDKDIKAIAPIAYLSLFIVAAVNLLLIMLAPEAVRIFAPQEYYEAIYCIPPVAMGVLFLYSYDLFAKFAFYYEKTKLIMGASIVGAILNIILNYFGIKWFGYVAAAYTTLICYILYCVFHYIVMTKICNDYLAGVKPYNTKFLILFALVFLTCGFAMLFTYDYPIIRYSIIAVAIIVMIVKKDKIKESFGTILALRKE